MAALLLAFVGALGTGTAPFGRRLLYWMAVILPGSLLGLALTALVQSWGRLRHRRWFEAALVAFLISIPHSFLVVVASALFFGIGSITAPLVLNFWLAVFILSLALTAINYLAIGREPPPEAVPAPKPAAPTAPQPLPLPPLPPPLAARLPPRLRQAALLAVEAEDHYLRIHTDAGSDLILMRLGDACQLLADVPGLRVHRSWWVARAAVAGADRADSRRLLRLRGGQQVPVSRTLQPALRREGWID